MKVDPQAVNGAISDAAKNLFDLTGSVAIVTGASRGLGQYFGRALARAGADLVITSRDAAIAARRSRPRSRPWAAARVPLALDVRDHDSIQRMAEAALAALRQDRHPGQQRRLQRAQAGARGHLGRLEPGARHQPARHVLRRPGRRRGT